MTKTELRISQLQTAFELSQERASTLGRDLAVLKAELAEAKKDQKASESVMADLRRDLAVATQRLDEHVKRTDAWDGRRWGLFSNLVTFILGLIGGLIINYFRKP